jgi:Ca2+-binding RTX toxin-like protein
MVPTPHLKRPTTPSKESSMPTISTARLAAGLAALGAFALPATASALPTCTYNAATARVQLALDYPAPNGAYSLARMGAQIGWLDGRPGAAFTACGAATVFNTDRIDVTGTPFGDVFVIDLTNGPFAPGMTPEAAGLSEIETRVDLGVPANVDAVEIEGSAGNDYITGGQNGVGALLSLNLDNDADLQLRRDPRTLTLRGNVGNDVLGLGGIGLGLVPYGGRSVLDGGLGNDALVGGDGRDRMVGGADLDSYDAGAGVDSIDSRDGIAETVDTGVGADTVTSDPFDTVI